MEEEQRAILSSANLGDLVTCKKCGKKFNWIYKDNEFCWECDQTEYDD